MKPAAIFLSPHNDDETLFGSFTLQTVKPHVVIVLRSDYQNRFFGIEHERRELETKLAMEILGCHWEQWRFTDDTPDWDAVRHALHGLQHPGLSRVYAPAVETDGHPHHNALGQAAVEVFGEPLIWPYLTYSVFDGKSTMESHGGYSVNPENGQQIINKLRALACYRSQILTPEAGCWPHFIRDQAEYVTRLP